jgi:hypothetical protein
MTGAYSQLLALMKQQGTPDTDIFDIGEVEEDGVIVAGGNNLQPDEDYLTLDSVKNLATGDRVLLVMIDTEDDADDYYIVLGKIKEAE